MIRRYKRWAVSLRSFSRYDWDRLIGPNGSCINPISYSLSLELTDYESVDLRYQSGGQRESCWHEVSCESSSRKELN